ncbi:MAG: hypothetical protein A2Z08_05165 [Deltaproteobacteria bacterium RBG_16_54_11]|nr:MAG: hypothetical protein A2Z08_05165 [Deltaproteobacteria bacterium RBG_16_54_11]
MKLLQKKRYQYKTIIIALIITSLFLSWGIGYAQDARRSSAKTGLYEMDGRLQAFNLDERWARIGGFKWSLADEFDAEEFAARLGVGKTGTVEFTARQKTWATFYVVLGTIDVSTISKLKVKTQDKRNIKLVLEPSEMKSIYEQGGKIYKIVPCGE